MPSLKSCDVMCLKLNGPPLVKLPSNARVGPVVSPGSPWIHWSKVASDSVDETRWTVRVTASAQGGTHAHVRKFSFEAGAPLSFDVEHPAVTALEYLLGAVAVDIASGVRHVARKRRVEVDDVEVVIHGSVGDPLRFLRVVGAEGDPGLASIEAKVYISSLEDEHLVSEVWNEMLAIAPVVNTLRKATRLQLVYQQVL